jgi:hypothetical protein
MGFTNSPSWAQAVLEEIFDDVLQEIECFIDDIGIFDTDWTRHLTMIDLVLTQLEEHGFTVNPQTCEWAVAETDWLGYWMTPKGLKPWQKKIEPILALAPPKTVKQLRSFIGMINFYRDMWRHRAHILTPLTALTKVPKTQFAQHWTAECDRAFAEVKAMICHEVLLTYPDPNIFYDIKTDASDKQPRAVIYQANKPITFFSRKLTSAQTHYPTIDKEALSILETLQEFCSLLWGSKIRIYTDHTNLIYRNINSQRILNWQMIIEEFTPGFFYKPGLENIGADTMSRYPMLARKEKQDEESPVSAQANYTQAPTFSNCVPPNADPEELDDKLKECLLYYPDELDVFPLAFPDIATSQQGDENNQALLLQDRYELQEFYNTQLTCRHDDGDQLRIVLPEDLIDPAIGWYHYALGHVGTARLCQTLRTHCWIPNLQKRVR